MTDEDKEQFLADRLGALATLFLMRRDDLAVVDASRRTGLDSYVYIDRADKPMRLMFGVVIRKVIAPAADRPGRIRGRTMKRFRLMGKFTYPVCLLSFTVNGEPVSWAWLAEPTIADGAPKLIHCEEADCAPLTDEFLDKAIDRIVAWYDAVETVLIA